MQQLAAVALATPVAVAMANVTFPLPTETLAELLGQMAVALVTFSLAVALSEIIYHRFRG